MNEIAAVLLYVMSVETDAETDAFWCFSEMMAETCRTLVALGRGSGCGDRASTVARGFLNFEVVGSAAWSQKAFAAPVWVLDPSNGKYFQKLEEHKRKGCLAKSKGDQRRLHASSGSQRGRCLANAWRGAFIASALKSAGFGRLHARRGFDRIDTPIVRVENGKNGNPRVDGAQMP